MERISVQTKTDIKGTTNTKNSLLHRFDHLIMYNIRQNSWGGDKLGKVDIYSTSDALHHLLGQHTYPQTITLKVY